MTSREIKLFIIMTAIVLLFMSLWMLWGYEVLAVIGLLVMFGSWIYAGTRGIKHAND